MALFGLIGCLGLTASQPETGLAQTTADPRPNILFVLTDDMNVSDLSYMPNTQGLLAAQGVKFTNAFVTRTLCCPSRATILRGQYAHNHQVWVNVPPMGGFQRFYEQGLEGSTIATWLNDAGYDTILIGKYLNRYGYPTPTTYVPPGWDRWHVWEGQYQGTDTSYQINENGLIETYYRSDMHDTDLFAQTAENFIRQTAGGAPFFMYLAPNAPHKPAYYASRHASMFSDEPLPRPPNFNERDVSDKPAWVGDKRRLSSTEVSNLTTLYRNRLRALQSVDEMVGRLVSALDETGELSNTYVVFTSDNGHYLGEHRLDEKAAAYEEALRIPLLIRGPSVPQGVTRSRMVLNNDFAPTFASWASATPPDFVDGRSLSPLLSATPPATWRTAFLAEHRRSAEEYPFVRAIPNYDAVRTPRYAYVEYKTGETELYDLSSDPYQLSSIHASADPKLLSRLKSRLDTLKPCASGACKTAEDGR